MYEAAWSFPYFPNQRSRADAKFHTQEQAEWVQRMVELRLEASREGVLSEAGKKGIMEACEGSIKQAEEFESYVLTPGNSTHPYSHVGEAGVIAIDIAEQIIEKENKA